MDRGTRASGRPWPTRPTGGASTACASYYLDALDEDGASVVDIALKAGSDDCASELIKAGGSASSADDGGAARLRAAACAGDACLIERPIKAGLRPRRACADDGRTAPPGRRRGASRVAAKLVELGADVKRADRQGRNARSTSRAPRDYALEARLRLLAESLEFPIARSSEELA